MLSNSADQNCRFRDDLEPGLLQPESLSARSLRRYLRRVVSHPTMLQDPDVREFLEKEEVSSVK